MITIHKYPLQVAPEQTVAIPLRAQFLSVQMQAGVPCMWLLVDSGAQRLGGAVVHMFGTGHEMPDLPAGQERRFMGTVQDGPYVWHYFEVTPKIGRAAGG